MTTIPASPSSSTDDVRPTVQTAAFRRLARRYVPDDLDCSDWAQLQPLYQQLIDRPLASAQALRRWLEDLSELTSVVAEFGARRRIEQSCHTEDETIEKAFLHWIEQISPKIQPLFFQLQKKLLDCPHLSALGAGPYDVLTREWRSDVELFRDENVPLFTQVTKLASAYDKLNGAMMVEFDGRQQTLQQLARYLDEPDRQVRQTSWTLAASRRLEDCQRIEALFEEQLSLRARIAAHAGLANYRDYAWKAMGRFDYAPTDCERFHAAIEQSSMPLVEAMDRKRREALGLESLRPWDLSVDPLGRPPLRPFGADAVDELVSKTTQVFARVSPMLAEDFARLQPGRNLDLASRRGKRAGGYQSSLEESGEPFIFMNAVGLQRDVETLLHEGGHAFHFMWAMREPLVFLRHAPMEFCEVASMSMELICADHLDVFYGSDDAGRRNAARAKRSLIEGVVRFFPWMATIDAFQHWLYTHVGHSREERAAAWAALQTRFASREVDWTGYEPMRAALWQRQLHLFHHPFYYVEYGIAQLGALQLWMRYREDPQAAMQGYREAMSLGGTRTLPELFEAAGIRFDFSAATFEPLMRQLADELERLPL